MRAKTDSRGRLSLQSSELQEQIAVVDYCTLRGIDIVHIPNEGKRSVVAGAMLKRAGMRPGFPDLFVSRPRGKYHGLFIEMKYNKGKTTKDQDWWLATLSREGYAVRVCYGFDEAVRCIEAYLKKGVYHHEGVTGIAQDAAR